MIKLQDERNHFLYDLSIRLHSIQNYISRLKNKSSNSEEKILRKVSSPRRFSNFSHDEIFRARNVSIATGESPRHRKSCLNTIPNMKTKGDGVRKHLSIYFGHKNWNLVLNIMIGIRTCLKNLYLDFSENINDQDYKIKCEYDLIQKRTRNLDIRKTCRFYDYAPRIFENIRTLYEISNESFLRSIGPEQLLVRKLLYLLF
jgi:hypothetical protein